ncbi:isoprenoid synthase domain-containing protein [Fomitopsis serialis]|uniref:isoprenoid synthase domain-containing protein n=1 Tax=Fomitopsis serialis TaxID=139415 RepID=UPI0020087F3E|nr:isoprenoid synthase domain-containing protein [Neoantrodia serialis]KAH9922479.1 isoprenoid synthase domain-containing protein [Neoantrodia serialis]
MSSPLPASSLAPTKIVIPDLVSHCTIPVRCNRHNKQASVESKQWLFRGGDLSQKKRDAFHGLKAGYLTSMCYPLSGFPQLRMDDRGTLGSAIKVMDPLYHPHSSRPTSRVGKMTKDYWQRLIQTASPGAQQRFIETFDMFFQAITEQARDRANGVIPDLESYIAIRRDTSGCKPCWALIEYANNLDLSWEVMDHPIIRGLGEAANDLVTWSNDIFSFNVEQSKGDTHNMIIVVQKQQGLDLQSAVDFVGDLCKHSIDRFHFLRENLPSWDPETDQQVAVYVDGLADWITGSLKWSFESERYFGKQGLEVKRTRVVTLLPRRA